MLFVWLGSRVEKFGTSSQHTYSCNGKTAILSKNRIKLYVTHCSLSLIWYERFMQGLHNKMGDDVRPDLAISVKLLLSMLKI